MGLWIGVVVRMGLVGIVCVTGMCCLWYGCVCACTCLS